MLHQITKDTNVIIITKIMDADKTLYIVVSKFIIQSKIKLATLSDNIGILTLAESRKSIRD